MFRKKKKYLRTKILVFIRMILIKKLSINFHNYKKIALSIKTKQILAIVFLF